MKRCANCKELKPLDDFQRDSSHRDGRRSRCKACLPKRWRPSDAARQREWKARNPDKRQKYVEQSRAKRAQIRGYEIINVDACVVCGKPLTQPRTGRRRFYCSWRCRKVAKESRNVADSGTKPDTNLDIPH